MNKVILIGNLAQDIKMNSSTKTGHSIATAVIAVNNGKDKDGNEIPADFLKFYAFHNQADNLARYCKKGSKIAIEGRIKNRSWDKQDGTKAYETTVYANNITFLNTRKGEGVPLPEEPNYGTSQENMQETDPFASFGEEVVINDDDLPF